MDSNGYVYALTRGDDRRTHFASMDAALAWASKEGYTEQVDRINDCCVILMDPDSRTFANISQYTLWA